MNAPETPPELVEGTFDQILYINDASGYVVAVVERADDDGARRRITIVGELGTIEIGAGLRLCGRFEKHPRFGEQFRVQDLGFGEQRNRKYRLAIAVSGVSERPELAPGDRFGHGERVPPQQVDVLVAERR